jgi:NADH-quinone oxidoreductase subunit N
VVSTGQIWLAVVAVVFSLIGAYYYLRIVKLMYFDAPAEAALAVPASAGHGEMRLLLSMNGLLLLAIGLLPQPLMSICFAAIKSL